MGGSIEQVVGLESEGIELFITMLVRKLTTQQPFQAKLKSVHEVVVRNRLEQLRKRQRDEAIQAQEELLAGVAKSASRKWGTEQAAAETEVAEQEVITEEEMEPYDRSMSPVLLDITKLPVEEREIDILTEEEDRRALVSVLLSYYVLF